MIDYEMLCQTIEDWRAGRRPSIDLSAPPVGTAEEYAEPGYDDGQYAEPQPEYEAYPAGDDQYAAEPGYEEDVGQYAAEPEAQADYEAVPDAGYEDVPDAGYEGEEVEYEYDGAPAPVAGGGTAPVVVEDDLDPELEDEL